MRAADEQDWQLRAAQGDRAAFAWLVQQHQTAVFNVAYRLLGSRRDAEDASQEAFLRAYRALERYDPLRPFGPWIKRITANLCYNRLEAQSIRPALTATDLGRADDPADLDDWAAGAPTPEQTLLAQEQAGRIRAAILRLPPRYRTVIELRHFQELSYEEIAAVMERPLSTIKSDLFRARKKLAGLLTGNQQP